MVSAPNLERAIDRASRFYEALARAAKSPGSSSLRLRSSGSGAELSFYSTGRAAMGSATFVTALVGAAFHINLFGWLIGDEIKVLSAETNYGKIIKHDALAEIFPWPLSYSRDLGPACDFRITFSSRYLQRPVIRTGLDIEALDSIDVVFTAPSPVSVAVAIRRIYCGSLSRGAPLPSTARLATLCNRSAATLRRHLSRDGTSIRAIREECLRERALQLLEDRGIMLSEVAARLGFSDGPCFRRAFRRWTGASPSAFRRKSVQACAN
jgi:AraC-like DNA-binding protein